MSEGNPAALTILMNMITNPEVFAPANPIMEILSLDSMEIYGSNIWDLGEYVCEGKNLHILRQISLNHSYGKLSRDILMDHIKKRAPFKKLYTIEELKADFREHKLPCIE